MPMIVISGALFSDRITKSDPTRPANNQKNLSQPDPLVHRVFGLRRFRPEISAWAEIAEKRPKSLHFSEISAR